MELSAAGSTHASSVGDRWRSGGLRRLQLLNADDGSSLVSSVDDATAVASMELLLKLFSEWVLGVHFAE